MKSHLQTIGYIWLIHFHSMSRHFCYWASLPWSDTHHSNRTILLDFRTSLNSPLNAGHSTSGTKDHFLVYNSLSETDQQLQSVYLAGTNIKEPSGCFPVKTQLQVCRQEKQRIITDPLVSESHPWKRTETLDSNMLLICYQYFVSLYQ